MKLLWSVLLFVVLNLKGEDNVSVNLVARSKLTHRNIPIRASDLTVFFDGARQPVGSFETLGCKTDSQTTASVILSSTEILQSTHSGIGAGSLTESGGRQAVARKTLEKLPLTADVEAYAWAPRLLPIRMFQNDGNMETFSASDALRVFDRHTIISTGGILALNHFGNLARWSDLELLANHLANRPGRKALIWYCTNFGDRFDGFPADAKGHDLWAAALLALNRENIAVYPIDCSMSSPQPKPDFEKLIGSEPISTGSRKMDKNTNSETVIASYTGGRFYPGMNKLASAIQDGLSDSQCSYRIGWPLSDEKRTRLTRTSASRIHSVKIAASSSDIELLYPEVYLEATLLLSEAKRLTLAESGLTYRLPLSALSLQAQWKGSIVQLSYGTASLTFSRNSAGILQTELDLIWAYYDANGSRLNPVRTPK